MIRVLIADDHPVVREGVASILAGSLGINVVAQAASGEEAIALTNSLQPHVVLLDMRLPEMSGANACAAIRKRFPQVRVVMLTAASNRSALAEAQDAGAHGFVLKASGPAALREAVLEVARGKPYVDPAMRTPSAATYSGPRSEQDVLGLTRQERRVLELVPMGLTNRRIGEELGICETTVKTHLKHAMQKLNVSRRAEAAALVQRGRLT